MLSKYAGNWWMVALAGLLAIVFGMTAIIWPQPTLQAMVLVFGVFALSDGILALVTGIAGRWWALALAGIAGILAGVATIAWPSITAEVLLYFIAGLAITKGVLEIVAAIELRRVIEGEWLLLVEAALSIMAGVLLVAFPAAAATALVWVIGLYAIVNGTLLVALGLEMHDWMKRVEKLETSAFGSAA